jgi:hypothetical protein
LTTTAFTQNSQNRVVIGPNYEKGLKSTRLLKYDTPAGWSTDKNAVKELGLYDVLVPNGETIKTTPVAITVAFQKKDANDSGLNNLENFYRTELAITLSRYPNAQFARWQPTLLNPDKIPFMSIEIVAPNLYRVLFIDSGDGYYSISLSAPNDEILNAKEFDDFFNSIRS